MVEEQEIKVIGVDKERMRENAETKTWVIPFKLSARPDESWARHFYEVHRKNTELKKKETKLIADCIEVGLLDTDDQQKILDALNKEIVETNAIYTDIVLRKKKMQEDLKDQQQRRVVTLQKLKDDSDKLKF